MTRKAMLLPLIGFGVIGMLTLVAWAEDEREEQVTLDQVPATVKAAILTESAGGKIIEIERELGRLKKQLSRLDLLVLDELGYVPASKLGAELLFDVISTAYERTSLIVTTNLPFENWVEVLGSERLTGATLDRLTHRCHILECNGQSYRLADAKRKRRQR